MISKAPGKAVRYRKYSHMRYGVRIDGKETIFGNSRDAKAVYRMALNSQSITKQVR